MNKKNLTFCTVILTFFLLASFASASKEDDMLLNTLSGMANKNTKGGGGDMDGDMAMLSMLAGMVGVDDSPAKQPSSPSRSSPSSSPSRNQGSRHKTSPTPASGPISRRDHQASPRPSSGLSSTPSSPSQRRDPISHSPSSKPQSTPSSHASKPTPRSFSKKSTSDPTPSTKPSSPSKPKKGGDDLDSLLGDLNNMVGDNKGGGGEDTAMLGLLAGMLGGLDDGNSKRKLNSVMESYSGFAKALSFAPAMLGVVSVVAVFSVLGAFIVYKNNRRSNQENLSVV
eukprot:gb/GECH01011205.1/.p1 GENE.gb/GECH01011205.1/~~gb/GECH01011205.1/.p1  ORF type:complete len:283 (+),score=70.39 gb/GECH01011205.1/:1-849(+)